jgi:hypothetical protein
VPSLRALPDSRPFNLVAESIQCDAKIADVALYAICSERGNGGFRWRILVKLPENAFSGPQGFDFENKLEIAFSERNGIAIVIIQRPLDESDSPRVTD